MRQPLWRLLSVVGTLAALGCGGGPESSGATPSAPLPPVAVTLGVAGRSNEHVSLAGRGAFVVVAWAANSADAGTDVYASVSADGARSFGPPVRVNQRAGDARANGEQPPRVALVPRESGPPEVVLFWLARREGASVLLTARSTDGGRTFGEADLVSGTDTVGNRGWQALGVSDAGRVNAVWLDHRRMAAATGGAAHQHHGASTTTADVAADGVAMAQRSDLYFASLDGGEPRAITPGVCYCCKTAIVHGPGGAVHLAWRHVYPGNLRDIAFASSFDGGRTFGAPVRVAEDQWSVAGCPDDGPSMAVDGAGRVHVVWPTMVTEDGVATKSLVHAMTTDGRTFSPRVRITSGAHAHHPQVVAAPDGSLAVAWDESWGDGRRIREAVGRIPANGAASFETVPPSDDLVGRYPAMAVSDNGVVTAWVSGVGSTSQIRVLRR